jgi:prepilin-type N-terminal cleavage/methylation domain-containing protein
MKTHTTSLKAKFNSAFSLVELLVVIAVIAVIAAIAIPNITGAREAAVAAQTSYNAQALTDMQNKVEAMTGTRPSEADLQTGVSVTNGTNVITFRLD